MKYTSDFVMRMRELSSRCKPKLLWDSSDKNTYVKTKHGDLI